MINFSIAIENLDDFKSPKDFLFFLNPSEMKNKNRISFVGKIALKKAFFNSLKEKINFKKIEVKNSISGKPYIEIKDERIKEKLKNKKVSVSISHTKDLAIAICFIYE